MTSSAFIYGLVVDFKVQLIRPRERRAMRLIGAALAAIVAVSVIYLRPAVVTGAPVVAKAPVTTNVLPKRVVILNPGTDVYFTWQLVVPGGSGGHRAG
jgi:hypothetical protein